MEEKVNEKYYLSDKAIEGLKFHNERHKEKGTGFIWKPKNEEDIASTLRANASICPTDNTIQVVGKLDIKGQDSIKRVYSDNGCSPTLTDMQGGNRQPKILIKNATKKGYVEATDGDSVNLSYPESKTRRGRVGKEVAQTLQCNESIGVVENLRIRKLIPLECWRLQGFDDEDFYRAKERLNNVFYKGKDKSNSQLYKQAGNSITVNVLEKILSNLLGGKN